MKFGIPPSVFLGHAFGLSTVVGRSDCCVLAMSCDPQSQEETRGMIESCEKGKEKEEQGDRDRDGKWYPGKFLNRLKQQTSSSPDSTQQEKEERSTVLSPESPSTTSGSSSAADDEERKNESMICSTIRSIRLKYLERQLVGRIYLYRLSGVISTAVTSDVTSDDIMNYYLHKVEKFGPNSVLEEDSLVQAEITGQYKRALSTVDTILNSLERRSLAYGTAEFTHTTLLTRGTTIGVSDPFFGLIGFSFTLELSATAHSLLASRRRYEITRDLALEKQQREEEEERERKEREKERVSSSSSASDSASSLSRISFSFFGKKQSEKNLNVLEPSPTAPAVASESGAAPAEENALVEGVPCDH
jgi:hypothetical protein